MTTKMRAKVRVTGVQPYVDGEGKTSQEILTFHFPARDGPYPADGSDEDQQFARYSPVGALTLAVANPALLGKFKTGDTFYLDFIPVPVKNAEGEADENDSTKRKQAAGQSDAGKPWSGATDRHGRKIDD